MPRELFTTARIPYRGYGLIVGRTIEKFPTYLIRFEDGDSRWMEDNEVCDDERDSPPIYNLKKIKDIADNVILWRVIEHKNRAKLKLVK